MAIEQIKDIVKKLIEGLEPDMRVVSKSYHLKIKNTILKLTWGFL
jgi:hypothetical protein